MKIVFIRDSRHDHVELIMNETISHLDIDAHISQRLILKFVDNHRENRSNRILTFSKLTEHIRLTIFIAFVIFELQRYARYDDSDIFSFIVNDFDFNNSFIYANNSSSDFIAFDEKLQVSQYHDRHIDFQAKNMKKKRDFVVMMKTFVVELILQLKINKNIEIVSEMHVFTKFIDADFVDSLNVEISHDENDSFAKILIARKTKTQIRINDIKKSLQRVRLKQIFMMSRCEIDDLVDIHRIVNIQNVLNESSDFLTIFFDERKILKTHVDDEKKNFDVISKRQFLQTHIDNDISKSFRNNRKTLFEVFAKTYHFSFKRNDLVNIAEIRKDTTDDHEISFSLHRDFVSKNQFDCLNKLDTIDIFLD